MLGDVRSIKLLGTGLAAAALIDATIGCCVLVPATMELLGERNWWMPGWLLSMTPSVTVEPGAEPVEDAVPVAA